MAAGIDVTHKIHGIDELLRKFRAFGNAAAQRKALEEDLMAAAAPIVEAAQRDAPRDPAGRPGFGAETIHAVAQETRRESEIARIAIGPGPTGWHLKFAELGTSRDPARPWLRPALYSRLNDALSILGARLGARLRKAWARG